jgi:hypothetical protein
MTTNGSHLRGRWARGLALLAIAGVSLVAAPSGATGQTPDEAVDCLGAVEDAEQGRHGWSTFGCRYCD